MSYSPQISDATATNKGIVQLSGDLGGSATTPTVTGINGVSVPSGTPANGQVLTSNGSALVWQNPNGGEPADGTITEPKIDAAFLHTIEAVIRWDGTTGSQPLRTTGTADTLRPVRWRQPTPPPAGGGYAVAGLDVWERIP